MWVRTMLVEFSSSCAAIAAAILLLRLLLLLLFVVAAIATVATTTAATTIAAPAIATAAAAVVMLSLLSLHLLPGVEVDLHSSLANGWAQSAHRFCGAYECDKGMRRVLNATALGVAFLLPPLSGRRLHGRHASRVGRPADVRLEKATVAYVTFRWRPLLDQGELLQGSSGWFEVLEVRGACSRREDVVWSRENAEEFLVFVFFAKPDLSRSCCEHERDMSFRRDMVLKAILPLSRPQLRGGASALVTLMERVAHKCGTVEVLSSALDTLTSEFELYVRLRERRQWDSDFPELVFNRFEVCPGVGTIVIVVTVDVCMHATCRALGGLQPSPAVGLEKATAAYVAFRWGRRAMCGDQS
ncbi:hypothetical protein Taro_023323 [Colocasia esculenta]|uniref:Uncharacterized protein n=1 Tax=Colocasia esculenta TaxID=4460 RepID=A0A843VB34_COLES|nr:hypothetical protein [Colocasia esculenta]